MKVKIIVHIDGNFSNNLGSMYLTDAPFLKLASSRELSVEMIPLLIIYLIYELCVTSTPWRPHRPTKTSFEKAVATN